LLPDGWIIFLPLEGGLIILLRDGGGEVLLRLKIDSEPLLTPVGISLFDLGAPIPPNVLP